MLASGASDFINVPFAFAKGNTVLDINSTPCAGASQRQASCDVPFAARFGSVILTVFERRRPFGRRRLRSSAIDHVIVPVYGGLAATGRQPFPVGGAFSGTVYQLTFSVGHH